MAKIQGEICDCEEGKKGMNFRDFYLLGSYPLVGHHVVNEPKVGCYVVSKLGIS